MIRTRTVTEESRNALVFSAVYPLYCGDLAQYQSYDPRITAVNFTCTDATDFRTAMVGLRIWVRAYRDDGGPALGGLQSRSMVIADERAINFFSFNSEQFGMEFPDLKAGLQLVLQVNNPNAFDFSFYARTKFYPRAEGDRC